MISLVGYSGFVGSNLMLSYPFEGLYNSQNIKTAYGTKPQILVYAGVTGTKYLANRYPEKDRAIIDAAVENIKQINPKKLVLISTVDVNSNLSSSSEDMPIEPTKLHVYGFNRFCLEEWVKENIKDYHILRLPALYGKNLKKNFIYDLIHHAPGMLAEDLVPYIPTNIINYYEVYDENYRIRKNLNIEDENKLEKFFQKSKFNSLQFTDSRAIYQFYNLDNLYKDLLNTIQNNIRLINLVTEPITASELYSYIFGADFTNTLGSNYIQYRLQTKFSNFWGKATGYIRTRNIILEDIKKFIYQNNSFRLRLK